VRQGQPRSVSTSAETQPTNVATEQRKTALVEAILPSEPEQLLSPSGLVSKREILELLPERVPIHWGYGPAELVRRLKSKLE